MADDKKIIFSMVNVSKQTPQGKQIIKDIHLSFYYGAKIGIFHADPPPPLTAATAVTADSIRRLFH